MNYGISKKEKIRKETKYLENNEEKIMEIIGINEEKERNYFI